MTVVKITIIGCGAILVALGIYAIFSPSIVVDVLGYKLVYGIDIPTFSSDGRLQISDMAQSMQGGLVIDGVKYGLLVIGSFIAFIGARR